MQSLIKLRAAVHDELSSRPQPKQLRQKHYSPSLPRAQ